MSRPPVKCGCEDENIKEIKRIDPLSVGRIFAVIGAAFGFIAGLALALLGTAIAVVIHLGAWLVQIVGAMLIFALGAFVVGVIYAAIYNVVAGWVGGIRVEFHDD